MNTLRALRADLKEAMESSGATVVDHMPERLVPPTAIVVAGSPWVEDGDTYGSFVVRYTVLLVCSQAPNAVVTDELDSALTAALVALDGGSWATERVDTPVMLSHANAHYLSVSVDVARTVPAIEDDTGGEG